MRATSRSDLESNTVSSFDGTLLAFLFFLDLLVEAVGVFLLAVLLDTSFAE